MDDRRPRGRSALLFFFLALGCALAQSPSLPSATVTGYRVGGPTIVCRDTECASVLQSLMLDLQGYEYGTQMEPLTDAYDANFCAAMAKKKPEGCSGSGPAIYAPAYNPLWKPSDCNGANGWLASLAGGPLQSVDGFTGDINEPIAGRSFRDARAWHDECWGVAVTRSTCDDQFETALAGVCGTHSACDAAADKLVNAVLSPSGMVIQKHMEATYKCAAWRYTMEEHACPASP